MSTPTTHSGLDLHQLVSRRERVFPAFPQVGRYFPAVAIEDARRRLSRTIERGDGPGLVIGPPGTGKSLLLQILAAQYHERFDVVLLAVARICTRRALLQAILFELGLPYRLRDEGQLRLSLLDHLLSAEESPSGLLLLVDEAQALSVALLDELRVMTNLVQGGAPRVRIVLAGSAAIEESFSLPDLESFSQRLSARCYLAHFNREETTQFIRAQVAACGGAPDAIFTSDAASAVFDATDGVPRLVSQLCDRALLMADEHNRPSVDRDLIQAAWSDLQQLPTPWTDVAQRPASSALTSVVEFGGLDLDMDDAESASETPTTVLPDVPLTSVDDIEPTELDFDDEAPVPAQAPVVSRRERRGPVPGDPFSEEFDEEEVVLDSFAPWGDMLDRDMLRVENRREPQFASLVQAAIDAAPESPAVGEPMGGASSQLADEPAATLKLEPHDDEAPLGKYAAETDIDIECVEEAATVAPQGDWPPLRLAIVSEPTPLKSIPLMVPAENHADALEAARREFDADAAKDVDVALRWPAELTARLAPRPRPAPQCDTMTNTRPNVDSILVVEDDVPLTTVKPDVRREEYRHLFSRLRSG